MPTFNNSEAGSSVRGKLNTAINRLERTMVLDEAAQLANLVYDLNSQWGVSAGMDVFCVKENFSYVVLASGATTWDIQPGAVKLDLLPGADGSYNFRGMLPAANGTTNDYPLLAKLLAKPGDGLGVYFPRGNYFMGQTIELKRTVRFHGDNGYPGNNFGRLTFAADTSGIVVNRINTINGGIDPSNTGAADSSVIERLAIYSAGGTDRTKHGIWLRARASLRSLYIYGFPGNGLQVIATAGGGGAAEGNANCFYIENVVSTRNGSNGFYAEGADANAGTIINLDCASNGWNGIWDSSFLGNVYVGCHAASNGRWAFNGGKYYSVSFGGKYYIGHWNATEAQLAATEPGTNNNIWYDTGLLGGPVTGTPLWTAGQPVGTYFSSFSYRSDGAVSQNFFVGCYNELDGYCAFQGAALVMGGTIPNVVTGNPIQATSSAVPSVRTMTFGQSGFGVNITDGGGAFTITNPTTSLPWRLQQVGNSLAFRNGNAANRDAFYITGDSATVPYKLDLLDFIMNGTRQGVLSAAPTTGFWPTGSYVQNLSKASGVPRGWRCTVGGTPGTWVADSNWP